MIPGRSFVGVAACPAPTVPRREILPPPNVRSVPDVSRYAVFCNDLSEPIEGILRNPAEGGVVHIHQPEPVGIAAVPLEIIQQRPVEIASDVGTGLDSLGQASEIPGQKIDAVRVVNGSVQKKLVVAAEAVFCDVPRQAIAFMEKPRAVVQYLRSHGPFQGGPGEAGIPGHIGKACPLRPGRHCRCKYCSPENPGRRG